MAKKKILFVTYGGGHVNMIIPLVKALKRDHGRNTEPLVLGLTTAKAVLDHENIDAFSMHDFLGKKNKVARHWGEKLSYDLEYSKIPYTESVAYLGLNYKDLIDEFGEEKAAELFAEKGRHAFLPIKLMRFVLSKIQPDVVVTTYSPRTERASIIAAQDLGIPTVCINGLFANQATWIREKGFADKVCVLNDLVKEKLIEHGRNETDIVVTGNPAFDRLHTDDIYVSAERLRFKKNWGIKKVLLWASQPEPTHHPFTGSAGDPKLPRLIDEYLIDMIGRHPDWHLVIRPHPSETLELKDLPDHVEISNERDHLPFLLKAVDAVVVLSSTIGLEAALINKPVYQIRGSMFYEDMPLDEMGYATTVPDLHSFEQILFDEDNKAKRRFSFEKATPKVINVIMEALQVSELRYFGNEVNKQIDAAP